MRNSIPFLCGILVLFFSTKVIAQPAEETLVQESIERFFLGMKNGDTTLMKNQLFLNCSLQTVGINKEGKSEIHSTEMGAFIQAIASKPLSQVYDERISSYDIKIDQSMAIAWTPYQFYLNENFLHCGVNAFLLIKVKEQWKIFSISDTRKNDDCEE
jgi:hypothetical protein